MALLGDRGSPLRPARFQPPNDVLQRSRIPRWRGVEAEPKTGRRLVDCSYAPEIFLVVAQIRGSKEHVAAEDFVFVNSDDGPLPQEWLNKRIWKPTLRRAGIRERGQYCIRDTFISLSLSAGEDPGWVARVYGTSEQMIFRHYRSWIPGLQTGAGSKIAVALSSVIEPQGRGLPSPKSSPCSEER
jgi:hypothetical protein